MAKKHYPDFNDFINSLTQEGYNAVIKRIEKHGNPKETLVSLLNTQPLVNTKTVEVRLNDRFFLWNRKKTFWTKQSVYLHSMEEITDCYHSWISAAAPFFKATRWQWPLKSAYRICSTAPVRNMPRFTSRIRRR